MLMAQSGSFRWKNRDNGASAARLELLPSQTGQHARAL